MRGKEGAREGGAGAGVEHIIGSQKCSFPRYTRLSRISETLQKKLSVFSVVETDSGKRYHIQRSLPQGGRRKGRENEVHQ
jgi:hypothetical protein